MSIRNTPSHSNIGTQSSKNATPLFYRKNTFTKSTSSLYSKIPISGGEKTPLTTPLSKGTKSASENPLNIGFCISSASSTITSSSTKTPTSSDKSSSSSSTKRFRPQTSTVLNACYTPSSLYKNSALGTSSFRNNKSTLNTPKNSIILKKDDTSRTNLNVDNLVPASRTPECFSKVRLETPRKSVKPKHDLEAKDGEISNLTVAVRVRPLNVQECLNPTVTNVVQVHDNELTVYVGTTADNLAGVSHSFQYDEVFWSCNTDDDHYADQETVFQGTGLHLVDKAFEGYNACLFAYGQTGSGKSYSMMGMELDDTIDDDCDENYVKSVSEEAGIIPRFCHELFKRIDNLKNSIEAEIEVSYFEIYNEKIHDLLCVSQSDPHCNNDPNRKNALKVREHPIWGPYVVDLSTHPIDSYQSLRNWLAVGNSQRATAATGMNDKSSRSHSIFNIILNISEMDNVCTSDSKMERRNIKQTKRSKISLVDLAGSERINHVGATGERIREGVSINKSLLTLGKVIAALAESRKGLTPAFVPYRESILTWLLRENLGGNSKTVMLATISPASIHVDDTLATLRYACQARTIVNRVKVNEDPHDKVIRELRAEVDRLLALRQDYERQQRYSGNVVGPPRKIIIETSVDESEVEALRAQLAETERELEKAQKSWMERLQEAENLRKNEVRLLRRKGLALELSAEQQKQACLVNLAADPILSGILFYILPPGIVRIGRSRPSAFSQPDIVLDGPLVAYEHCSIENVSGNLFVVPENQDFETYLNGELTQERTQMFHGDRLVIGGSHYFRISNPNCSQRNKNIVVDYQTAYQEILQKQEEQLRKELDEEKKAALLEIEQERAANERNYQEKIELLELEKFKYKCSKELLETEKKAFEENKETASSSIEYTPSYKSTILDDIKRIMQHPTEESLHQTQLKVKEATQRCRDLGVRLDFKQAQVLDEFGIFRAVVTILDKENRRKAEWPTARLDVWLDIIRHNENIRKENLFDSVDLEWMPLDNQNLDETLNDSLNSSRISLNVNSVKEIFFKRRFPNTSESKRSQDINTTTISSSDKSKKNCTNRVQKCKELFENPPNVRIPSHPTKQTIDTPGKSGKKFPNLSRKVLTYEENEDYLQSENLDTENSPFRNVLKSPLQKTPDKNEFNKVAYVHLKDIQRATIKLKKLCDRFNALSPTKKNMPYEKRKPIENMKKSIEQIEVIVFDLKANLTAEKLAESPQDTKTPKSVRFLLD